MGVVHPLGDPNLHFWLTRSMARSMGVSLSDAIAEGRLSARSYADLVMQCRACPNTADCQTWLGGQIPGTEEVPGFCLHARSFRNLTP